MSNHQHSHEILPLKKISILLFLSCFYIAAMSQEKKSNVHVGLIYPISSNGSKAGEYSNKFSLHLIAGLSRSETGVSLAGISNIVKDSVHGFQMAGFSNHVQNTLRGAQFAGFMNYVKHDVHGFQAAGYLNISGSSTGFQSAGFANFVKKNAGVQLSGFLNKAADVNTQVAGFINIAKKVKGVQAAGFINIADSSDYPIGIINLVKNGEKAFALTTDETLTTLLSFRSGGRVMYGILGIGYNLNYTGQHLYALEAGIGAHLKLSNQLRINTELTSLVLDDFKKGDYLRTSLKILPSLKLSKAVEVFAGPTFNYINLTHDKAASLTKHYLWSKTSNEHFYALYFGATGGIQVNLSAFKHHTTL